MTIQYCSDLHLELLNNRKLLTKQPLLPVGEVLLLAGDIVPFAMMDQHADFFSYLSDNFKQTYWLPGNHEYYQGNIGQRSSSFMEAIRPNLWLVNNEVVQLEKVRLVLSTLWSTIAPIHHPLVVNRIADFKAIQMGDGAFSPQHYEQLHQEALHFLTKAFEQDCATPTVAVTHHLPTFLNYPKHFKRNGLEEAFATELLDLVKGSQAAYWLYGHAHFNTPDFTIGNTKLITNQLGQALHYKKNGFRRDAMIFFD